VACSTSRSKGRKKKKKPREYTWNATMSLSSRGQVRKGSGTSMAKGKRDEMPVRFRGVLRKEEKRSYECTVSPASRFAVSRERKKEKKKKRALATALVKTLPKKRGLFLRTSPKKAHREGIGRKEGHLRAYSRRFSANRSV